MAATPALVERIFPFELYDWCSTPDIGPIALSFTEKESEKGQRCWLCLVILTPGPWQS